MEAGTSTRLPGNRSEGVADDLWQRYLFVGALRFDSFRCGVFIGDREDRREVVRKLGRYAAYAAPFTLMAVNAKAAGGSGMSGSKGAARRPHP